MCFVWISEQTAIISLYNINWLVCVTERECVYCAVRIGCLYIIQVASVLTVATALHAVSEQHHLLTWATHSDPAARWHTKVLHEKLTIAQLVSPLPLLEPKDNLPGNKNRPLSPSWSRPQSPPLSLSLPAATTQFLSIAVGSRWIKHKFQFQHHASLSWSHKSGDAWIHPHPILYYDPIFA